MHHEKCIKTHVSSSLTLKQPYFIRDSVIEFNTFLVHALVCTRYKLTYHVQQNDPSIAGALGKYSPNEHAFAQTMNMCLPKQELQHELKFKLEAFMHVNEKDLIAYPANVGSTCHSWENDSHPACNKDRNKANNIN